MKTVEKMLTIFSWILGFLLIFLLTSKNEYIERLSVLYICVVFIYLIFSQVLIWLFRKKEKNEQNADAVEWDLSPREKQIIESLEPK